MVSKSKAPATKKTTKETPAAEKTAKKGTGAKKYYAKFETKHGGKKYAAGDIIPDMTSKEADPLIADGLIGTKYNKAEDK